jgi:hypothetical protein
VLRRLGRTAVVRALIGRRGLRVAVTGAVMVLVSLALTVGAPLWLLALSPLVYGMPHLLADVRYLVVRPGFHRRLALCLCAGPPLVAASLGAGARAGFLAVVAAALCARATPRARAALAVPALLLSGLSFHLGYTMDLVLAHLHNFVAVALWWTWRRRRGEGRLHHLLPLGLFVLCTLLLLGWGDRAAGAFAALLPEPAGQDLDYQIWWLAPGLSASLGIRLVLCFAFAQAVHYGIWVRLIPEEDRPQRTPRSFGASVVALRADLGAWPLLLTFALALALCAWAIFDLAAARVGYFRLALFHGPLEFCAVALFILEGRGARSESRPGHTETTAGCGSGTRRARTPGG